jgi:hypothetical protein
LKLEHKAELDKAKNFHIILDEIIQKISKSKLDQLKNENHFISKQFLYDHQLGIGSWLRNSYLKKPKLTNQIPFFDPFYLDCYSTAITYLIKRRLNNQVLFSNWILADCNWMELESIPILTLENISLRLRMYYAINCIEILAKSSKLGENPFSLLINFLKEFANKEKIGEWHYPYSEITPMSILNDEFNEADFQYIDLEFFNHLKKLYQNSETWMIQSINDLFEVATTDLYAGIVYKSQNTLE